MKIRYITDKDIVPERISHNIGHIQNDVGLFKIVYGVMQREMSYDNIYDLIVRLSKEQKSETVKRFNLLAWKVEVESILKKLKKYDVDNGEISVIIPFTGYNSSITYTINIFELVRFILNEILERGDEQMKVMDNPTYDVPPASIIQLIGNDFEAFRDHLPEQMEVDEPYYRDLYFDEMIRRGFTYYNSSRKEIVFDEETNEIDNREGVYFLSPSKYYNKPEKFFDVLDLAAGLDAYTRSKPMSDTEYIDASAGVSDSKPQKEGYTLGAVGTVFFMLKDLSEEVVEKKNKKKIVTLINYILDNAPDDDTTRSYVDKLLSISPKSHTLKFYSKVQENLKKYGFAVPKVIKEGLETKRNEKNR